MLNKLWQFFWLEKELKRQLSHMGFGLAYAALYFFGWMTPLISTVLLVLSILVAIFLQRNRGVWDRIVLMLERENHLFNIPLKGLIFYLIGCTLTIVFFDFYAALGGIVILAVADALGTLYGKYVGLWPIPWNKDKHLEGPIMGALLSGLMLSPFIPVWVAFASASVGALVDTLNWRIFGFEIDDNLLIPLISAAMINGLL